LLDLRRGHQFEDFAQRLESPGATAQMCGHHDFRLDAPAFTGRDKMIGTQLELHDAVAMAPGDDAVEIDDRSGVGTEDGGRGGGFDRLCGHAAVSLYGRRLGGEFKQPRRISRRRTGRGAIIHRLVSAALANRIGIALLDFLSHQADMVNGVALVAVAVDALAVVELANGFDLVLQPLIAERAKEAGTKLRPTSNCAETICRGIQSREIGVGIGVADRCLRAILGIPLIDVVLIQLVAEPRVEPADSCGRTILCPEIGLQVLDILIPALIGDALTVIEKIKIGRTRCELSRLRLIGEDSVLALLELELIAGIILECGRRRGIARRSIEPERIAERGAALLGLPVVLDERLEAGGIVGVERAATLAERLGEIANARIDAGDLVVRGVTLVSRTEDIKISPWGSTPLFEPRKLAMQSSARFCYCCLGFGNCVEAPQSIVRLVGGNDDSPLLVARIPMNTLDPTPIVNSEFCVLEILAVCGWP
jgi:hypothetical protein